MIASGEGRRKLWSVNRESEAPRHWKGLSLRDMAWRLSAKSSMRSSDSPENHVKS